MKCLQFESYLLSEMKQIQPFFQSLKFFQNQLTNKEKPHSLPSI